MLWDFTLGTTIFQSTRLSSPISKVISLHKRSISISKVIPPPKQSKGKWHVCWAGSTSVHASVLLSFHHLSIPRALRCGKSGVLSGKAQQVMFLFLFCFYGISWIRGCPESQDHSDMKSLKESTSILRVACSPESILLLFWIFIFWFYLCDPTVHIKSFA